MATERPMAGSLEDALARALAGEPRIWTDPGRLRAVLMGLSPGNQASRQALVAAAEEGIVQTLLETRGADVRALSASLQERTGMDRAFADRAVRLWSSALGLANTPEAWESPAPEPPAAAPVQPPSAERRRTSWPAVCALSALFLVLAGLLFQKAILPRPKIDQKTEQKPAPSPQAAVPENLERLKTTFVGTRSLDGKPPEVFSLQIRALHPEEGRIRFEYTLNSSGSRRDNLGAALPREGRIEIPDLGVGKFFLEHGRLVIVIQGASPENHWELRETS